MAYNGANDQVWILEVQTGAQRQVTNDRAAYFNPVWSPDSSRLVVSTISGRLKTIDLSSGQVYELDTGTSASWASDSHTVIYCKADRLFGARLLRSELCQIGYDGSAGCRLSDDPGVQAAAGRASPDGGRIAFATPDGELRIAPLLSAGAGQGGATGAMASSAIGPYTLGPATTISSTDITVQDLTGATAGLQSAELVTPEPAPQGTNVLISRSVPYIHQAYDTPDDFNGDWACNATSAMMCITAYNKLPYWDITCSTPFAHTSHYGRYISQTYSYNGYLYDTRARDASNNWAYGGYGYVIGNSGGWTNTWDPLSKYIYNHGLGAGVDGWPSAPEPTWDRLVGEINNQCPFILLSEITTAGHYTVTIGYVSGQRTAIFNDPWGNKNIAYPGYCSVPGCTPMGIGACYDWPGYNNGYQNLNYVQSFIYARPAFIVESRTGGQNVGKYSDTSGSTWADTPAKSTAPGATGPSPSIIGSRYGSTYRSVAGEKHAIFRADLHTAGLYEVFATWGNGSDRRSPILHRITSFGETTDRNVDQTGTTYNTWVSLGTYSFATGTDVGQVDVNNLNINASGSMYADAIKWEFRSLIGAPSITAHPSSQGISCGGTATFTVGASGQGMVVYHWQKNDADLNNGGHYSGVTTTTLTVSPANGADAADYRCVVSTAGGSATSNAATLTVSTAATDLDGDCDVDAGDAELIVACMAGPGSLPPGCAAKDLDHDTDVDQEDYAILQRCLSGAGVSPSCPN